MEEINVTEIQVHLFRVKECQSDIRKLTACLDGLETTLNKILRECEDVK